MTTSGSDKDTAPPANPALETTSIRELMGLEVEHLIPGLAIAAKMLRQGDNEGALRTYATLVLCEPTEPRFQIGLAACALKIGQYAVALQAASAVIAFTPDQPEGYHLSAHACIGLGEYDSAIEDFTEALRLAEAANNTVIAGDSQRMIARAKIMKERHNLPENSGADMPANATDGQPASLAKT